MFSQWFTNKLLPWLSEGGLKIVLILLVIVIVHYFGRRILDKIVRRVIDQSDYGSAAAERKREDTLIRIFHTTIAVILWTIGIIMILSEFGVDVGPLVAGAGLVGIAVGFGAQYLVRDVISGLFIILENQYRVGDVVELEGVSGNVEDITLRKTVVRDLDGAVHHIPNGEIKKSSNLSKDFARINIDIGVAYESDISQVERVINQVGLELSKDPDWSPRIKKAPEFVRINSFGDSAINIKILGDVEPQEQWAVAGEFRKRLKVAFDKEGINIPYPHTVVKQI